MHFMFFLSALNYLVISLHGPHFKFSFPFFPFWYLFFSKSKYLEHA